MKPIAICGRGTSLRRYAQFSQLFDKIYLVNPFSAEIEKLGRQHFKGKELTHVVSRGNDCRLKLDHYALFNKITTTANITKGITPPRALRGEVPTQRIGSFRYINFKSMPDAMKKRGFPLVGWEEVTSILQQTTKHADVIKQLETQFAEVIDANIERASSSENTSTTRCWPTTGIFAIELALISDSPQEVYLFGFDCFQKGTDSYFIGRRKSHQPKSAQEVMKYYLKYLVHAFGATQFHSADEQPHITEPNWNIVPILK